MTLTCRRVVRRAGFLVGWAGVMMGRSTPVSAQVDDHKIYSFALLELLEYRQTGSDNPLKYDLVGWVGGDFTRLWMKSEGAFSTRGGTSDFEVEALYGRLVHPYWDFQVGTRLDFQTGDGHTHVRGLAAIGLQGLAPYWFDMEPTLYVSQKGDVSARITTSYDVYLRQRFIIQARFELNAAVQEVSEFGVGSGVNDVDVGVRMRYEIRREFAPYLGVTLLKRLGGSARFAREEGLSAGRLAIALGVRTWF